MEDEAKEYIYNRLTLGVLQTLQKRAGVCDVHATEANALSKQAIASWEQKYSCLLPDDLKRFYLTCNGMHLKWKVKLNDVSIALGRMEIRSLEKLVRIGYCSQSIMTRDQTLPSLLDVGRESDEEADTERMQPCFDHRSRIFELDDCGGYGKVCYVYLNTKPGIPADSASVWFLDRALQWHPLAASFLAYYRLMLVHLGLPQWQYLFTSVGLSPQLQQWYNLYCRDRLGSSQNVMEATTVVHHFSQNPPNQFDVAKVFNLKLDKSKKIQTPIAKIKKPAPSARSQGVGVGKGSTTQLYRAGRT